MKTEREEKDREEEKKKNNQRGKFRDQPTHAPFTLTFPNFFFGPRGWEGQGSTAPRDRIRSLSSSGCTVVKDTAFTN